MTDQETDWIKEYNDGWDELVNTLVVKLRELDPNLEILQIKEKFGGLRAYISTHSEDPEVISKFNDLINEAEEKSYAICESCGKEGRSTSLNGWYRTLCKQDEERIIAERKEREAQAKAEREAEEQHKAEALKAAKASTVCRTCGETGKWRKEIRQEISVLCDDHFAEWMKEYEERKAFYMKKREELLAQKEEKATTAGTTPT